MELAEISAEPRGHELKRELRLSDLVLMQVLLVTTETCIGIAGRQGSTHLVFWVIGILLFFVPLAVVIRFLGQILPWEGGVYQWARVGLGPFYGFLAAWNFWIYSIFLTSSLGISIAESLAYAGGPSAAWMTTSFWLVTAVNVLVFSFILAVDVKGFRLGKWVSHFGTAAMLAVQFTLIGLLFVRPHHQVPPQHPFAWSMPPLTLLSLNLLTKDELHRPQWRRADRGVRRRNAQPRPEHRPLHLDSRTDHLPCYTSSAPARSSPTCPRAKLTWLLPCRKS